MNSPVIQGLNLNTPSYVKNARLVAWVADMAALCEPDTIYWCDGSEEEYNRLCEQLVAAGTMRKIPEGVRVEQGWSLGRIGDGGWWPAIERGLTSSHFDQELVDGLAQALRRAGEHVDWVTHVPSVHLGAALETLAQNLATTLGVPYVALVSRSDPRPPQREMTNAVQQAANVRGAFRVTATPPRGRGVLLDDVRHSGWKLAMVGGQLRGAGAHSIVPLTLGTLG